MAPDARARMAPDAGVMGGRCYATFLFVWTSMTYACDVCRDTLGSLAEGSQFAHSSSNPVQTLPASHEFDSELELA